MELESHKRQKIHDGYGATYHRVYSIALTATMEQAKEAMCRLQADVDKLAPRLLARFDKLKGEAAKLAKGDEFQIHITGPWNGPVRVADVSYDAFKLVTLEGHLEAGEINFRVREASAEEGDFKTVFEIESLARSRDAVVDLLYDKVPIAKLAQTEMWTLFCRNFAKSFSEGIQSGEVQILTERRDEETGEWQTI